MNTTIKYLLALCCVVVLAACGNAPAGEKVEAEEAVETPAETSATAISYNIDTEASQVNWIGAKPTGDQHTGLIKLNSGELFVENGNITGGTFELDMNSIAVLDEMGDEMKAKLEGHLKTGDFFEVEKFPTGTFEIASVAVAEGVEGATHNVTGNLTMKDITKSVTIPVKVELTENGLTASTPAFTINRTEWDVMYNSGVIGTVKDKLINDDVALTLSLSASPQQAEVQ